MKAINRGKAVAFLAGVLVLLTAAMVHAAPMPDGQKLLQYTAGGHVLGFDAGQMYVATGSHMLRVEFVGASDCEPVAEGGGKDEAGKAQPLTRVEYPGLWRNVSLVYESKSGSVLKSTYYVAPGGRPEDIRLKYNGPVQVAANGGIAIGLQAGRFSEAAPVAWQENAGKRISVAVIFKKVSDTEAGFEVGAYDKTLPLVIDPELSWNTFLGSSTNDYGHGIAVDCTGNVYVAGFSDAAWDGDNGSIMKYQGGDDAFVSRIDSNARSLWSTFLGSSSYDYGNAIAVDCSGNLYAVGYSDATWGSPPAGGGYKGGSDAFVAKLNSSGHLAWNIFLGSSNSDDAYAIAKGGNGYIYVVGNSLATWGSPVRSFTVSSPANDDAFVAKLADNGTLKWNTFLGGDFWDSGMGIAVDGSGNAYVTGYSGASWGSPVQAFSGSENAFIAKLADNGTLKWNTFLASSRAFGIAVDGGGNAYVTGYSYATWGSPIRLFSGDVDAFAAKLASNGACVWNTFLGGSSSDTGSGIAVDGSGNVYVAGYSQATWGTPERPFSGLGYSDVFAAKIDSVGALAWNMFLGGGSDDYGGSIAVDGSGNVYVAGESTATWGYPGRAFSGSGYYDAFVAKISIIPEMNVTGNGFDIHCGDSSPRIEDHTHFGSAGIIGGTVVRTFTIENTGDAVLNLTGNPRVAVSGSNAADFSITAQPDATVAPGSSTTFQVTFNPSVIGDRTAVINIVNNDPSKSPYNFFIKGTGVCDYVLSASSDSFTAAAGSGSFTMTTGPSCTWSAGGNPTWITISSATVGTGSTTVNYSVAANTGDTRSGDITIGGQTFTISQSSGCTFEISPSSKAFNGMGGSDNITVTTSGGDCPWAASPSHSWITFTVSSGTGSGKVKYTVAAHPSAPGSNPTRTGAITVGGKTFTITQTAHFLDPGDGLTMNDAITGLEWFKDANYLVQGSSWANALDDIEEFNSAGACGHNDWRLPTIDELAGMIGAGQSFTNFKNGKYWSSTNVSSSQNVYDNAWSVDFSSGIVDYNLKTLDMYVWPVRSDNLGQYKTMHVTKAGQGSGMIRSLAQSSKIEVFCDPVCFTAFDNTTLVTLEAAPDEARRMTFEGWGSGSCDSITSDNECIVTMDWAHEVVAYFGDPYGANLTHKAIIVAGSGPYMENNLWNTTGALVQDVYDVLLSQGYTDGKIYYLTFQTNGWPTGSDNESGSLKLEHAIKGWAADADTLVIYLMGHGLPGEFEINGLTHDYLQAKSLREWLDELQSGKKISVIVVYEGCYSGSFLPELAPGAGLENAVRIVITSASADEKAWFAMLGDVSFSQYFWSGVQDGQTVDVCFQSGFEVMNGPGYQTALMDADGDAVSDSYDLDIASRYVIGRGMVNAGSAQIMGNITGDQWLTTGTSAMIAMTEILPTPSLVWAVIRRPSDGEQTDTRAITRDVITLSPQGSADCSFADNNFTEYGVYTVSVYALVGSKISKPWVTHVIKNIDSFEDDDAAQDASPIVVNTGLTQYHNFDSSGDIDWVKFYGMVGDAGMQLYAILAEQVGDCELKVELYGPNDPSLFITDNVTKLLGWECRTDGMYYIKIYPAEGINCSNQNGYELKVYNPDAPVLGLIKGSIRDTGGSPILNAVITTDYGYSALSSNGSYEMPHAGGGFTLKAEAAGYEQYSQSGINLEARETLTLNIVMTPVGGATTTVPGGDGATTTTAIVSGGRTTTTIVVPGGSTTTTTTIRRLCPLLKALGDGSEAELETLRQFRDARLAKSAKGARLVGIYYRHAQELTMLFEKRPDIEAQVREIILELLPQIGGQKKLVLSNDMKQQLFDLIDELRADASPGLKKSLRLVRKKIEKGELELK